MLKNKMHLSDEQSLIDSLQESIRDPTLFSHNEIFKDDDEIEEFLKESSQQEIRRRFLALFSAHKETEKNLKLAAEIGQSLLAENEILKLNNLGKNGEDDVIKFRSEEIKREKYISELEEKVFQLQNKIKQHQNLFKKVKFLELECEKINCQLEKKVEECKDLDAELKFHKRKSPECRRKSLPNEFLSMEERKNNSSTKREEEKGFNGLKLDICSPSSSPYYSTAQGTPIRERSPEKRGIPLILQSACQESICEPKNLLFTNDGFLEHVQKESPIEWEREVLNQLKTLENSSKNDIIVERKIEVPFENNDENLSVLIKRLLVTVRDIGYTIMFKK